MPVICETYMDHEWRPVDARTEAGRHPTMGAYVRRVVRCRKCGRQTTQTEWLHLLAGRPPIVPGREVEP